MPYKTFKENDEWCVYKHDAGNKVGSSLGCHATESEAHKQMAAIYANENKNIMEKAVSLVRSFLSFSEPSVLPEQNETPPPPPPNISLTKEQPLAFWKSASGQWMWLARYSDSFRDDDWPVKEIVSSASHKYSIEMIDKGIYPMPELWLWHEPAWRWGEATVVAYDEVEPGVGFAMAGGTVDKGKEWIAEAINKSNHVLVSHGMPRPYVVRDASDPSIIAKHMTYEVSPLPSKRAAIKRTGFVVFQKGVDTMAVTDEKRTEMAAALGVSENALKSLEEQNKDIADAAKAAGTQNKEKSPPPAAEEDGEGANGDGEKKKEIGPEPVTAADLTTITTDIVKSMGEVIGPLVKQVGQLANDVAQLKAAASKQEEKARLEKEETTPAAGLYHQIMSAIEKSSGDGDNIDVPEGPVETKEKEPPASGSTLSPFLNNMIENSRKRRVGHFNMGNGGNGNA